jgi:hypothetical protein
MQTKIHSVFAAAIALALASPAIAADTSVSNPNGCKVVERQDGDTNPSNSISTSVTAGNGHVSTQSTGPNSVTVNSGNGSVSGSVATTTGSGGNSTTVTSTDGNCTIYVNPGQKKEN